MIREDTLQVLRCPVCDGLEIIHNIGKNRFHAQNAKKITLLPMTKLFRWSFH